MKNNTRPFLFLLLVVLLCSSFLTLAQSTSWTGTVDTQWRNAANWTAGIPDLNTDAVIGDLAFVNHPTLNKRIGRGACKSLIVGNGAFTSTLTINDGLDISGSVTIGLMGTVNDDGGNIKIEGDWLNSGSYTPSGSVRRIYFVGTNQTIGGASVTDFDRLYIEDGSITTLASNITISDFIELRGTLDPSTFSVSGTGDIDIKSGGVLQVKASTFAGNFSHTGSTNPLRNTSTIDYASSDVNQTIDNSISYRILQISGSMTKSLAGNTTIIRDLLIKGGTLDLLNFTADRTSGGGSISIEAGATLKIGGTNTFPSNYTTHTLATTSTVEYNGGNQTVTSEEYGNLILSSSSGTIIKIMPAEVLTIAGDLTSTVSAGTLGFTAANNVNVSGNITLSSSSTFNGSTFSHSTSGNWTNNGTFSGCGGTFTFNRAGAVLSGSGTNNFGDVVINGSGTLLNQNSSFSLCGNFSTSGGGSFTHTSGGSGVFSMSGSSKLITGSNISFSGFSVTAGGDISTNSTLNVAGDFAADGPFTAASGTIFFTGTSKNISGSAALQFAGITITGSISTNTDFSISANFNVSGSLLASSGKGTFNGTSTFSGTANLFDVQITSTATLTMGSGSVLGIAGAATLDAGGVLNTTSNIPNTINFNGTTAQSLVFTTYDNLIVSGGNTKTPTANLSVNGDFTITAGTTFDGTTFTHSLGGNWINNGVFSASSSTIEFIGTNDVSITGATTFNNLTLNKNATNEVTLINDINVSLLAMTSGSMFTDSNTVTITTNRTGAGVIIGSITRTHAFTTGVDYEFEGANNYINFTSISGSPITSINVIVTIAPNLLFESASSINRTYQIDVTTGGVTTYVAELRLHYEQGEVNGNNESLITMWRDVLGTWETIGKSGNSEADNWVEQSVSDLSYIWTIASGLIQYSWVGNTSSSWTEATNWFPIGIPLLSSVANIGNMVSMNEPVIDSNIQIKELFFYSDEPTELSIGAGGTLTVQGNINGDWDADATHIINVGAQTLTVLGDVVLSDGIAGREIDLQVSTGSVVVGGSVVLAGTADISLSGAASLTIEGDFERAAGATFTPSTSTVTYSGADLQQVADVTYYNLVIDKPSGLAVINSSTDITNDLTLSSEGQLDIQGTLSVDGDITISNSTTLNVLASDVINIEGDWNNSGTFFPGSGTVVFNGTGNQNTTESTFNNLVINKSAGILTLLGNATLNGDIDVQSGTVEIDTYSVSRSVNGGVATLGPNTVARFGGSGLQINNFSSLEANTSSTIEFYSNSARIIPPITYGNLIIEGTSEKTMVGPTTVKGNLTVNSGSTLTAPATTLILEGDFTVNGAFNAATGSLIFDGTDKNINGDITYNNVVINGQCDFQTGSATFNGDLDITATGDFDAGSLPIIFNGNFTNSGVVTSTGMVTFLGTQVQTIRLLNAITSSSAGVINFNGTVAPVFSSTSSPQFATVNINNTAPLVVSQPWSVSEAMNVNAGATWNGGPLTHTFYKDFTNSGTVISSGKLLFSPTTSANIDLGSNFTSNNQIEFGGTGQINLTDNNPTFESLIISNTNAAGITPASDWTVAQDLSIRSGAQLNGAALDHSVTGQYINNGTFNGQNSTITFGSTSGTDAINGSGVNNFNSVVFDTNTVMDIVSDISVSTDFTNNATTLNFIDQLVKFEGAAISKLGGTTVTNFNDLEIDKSSNGLQLEVDCITAGFLVLTNGTFDLNANTLSITNNSASAITAASGYILSENSSFSSLVQWTIGTDGSAYTFPFGTSSGELIPFLFDLNSGDAGTVSVATYGTGNNNLPLPPSVSKLNDEFGVDNSANTVDRFFLINLSGETNPNVDVTFNASATEVGTISSLLAQRWGGSGWEQPLVGQVSGATSVLVPGVTQFSPWTMSGNGMTLPVELVGFSAEQVDGNVVLKWKTTTELNNDYFEIQKSLDGEEFFTVGKVNGMGNSNSINSYTFIDSYPNSGQIFYVLKQVDFDGTSSLSEIILVDVVNDNFDIKVYPNPANDIFHVSVTSEVSQKMSILLYDQVGNMMLNKQVEEFDKQEEVTMDVAALNPGIYMLKVLSGSLIRSMKILVE